MLIEPETAKLENLFERRFHGAGNHRAVLFHSLFGSHLALQLTPDSGTVLGTEGYEDLEYQSEDGSLSLYQLKNHAKKLTASDIWKVLQSFAEVIRAKPVAKCVIVTTSGFESEVERWLLNPSENTYPLWLAKAIETAARGDQEAANLLREALQFQTVTIEDLVILVSLGVVSTLHLTQDSHEAFVHGLCYQMMAWSGDRQTVTYAMVAGALSTIQVEFERGLTNPAVANGLVVPLKFSQTDPDSGDFLDGRAARPSHIAANMDVRRPSSQQALYDALAVANVAAVIASSGQGKSTLALRHFNDHFTEGMAFEVRTCRVIEDAAAIAEFLRFRSRLGFEVAVLIDNLSNAHQAWVDLAAFLSGESVKFILTSREEDWKRYAGDLSRVSWRRITPELELVEARQIFNQLEAAGILHEHIDSAEQAFEKVSESKLLIEYVYLLTHGELLIERLTNQIKNLQNFDRGAIACLQVVSVADQLNLRLSVAAILGVITFGGDAQLTLHALEDEYVVTHDGVCTGLHPVRSNHIASLLHPYGIESTLGVILDMLPDEELPDFTFSVVARTPVDIGTLANQLGRRLAGASHLFADVWHSAYAAADIRHAKTCKPIFDSLEERLGKAALELIPLFTTAFERVETQLLEDIWEPENLGIFRQAVDSTLTRDFSTRPEAQIRSAMLDHTNDPLGDDVLSALAKACWVAGDKPRARELLEKLRWRERLLEMPLELASRLTFLLQECAGADYAAFMAERRSSIDAYVLEKTQSLQIEEKESTAVVTFVVDPYSTAIGNEQAVSRLKVVKSLLPGYTSYATSPIRPVRLPMDLPYGDDAEKDIPEEKLLDNEFVDLNRLWIDAVEYLTASDGLASWEWSHRRPISEAAGILNTLAKVFEARAARRSVSNRETKSLAKQWDVFEEAKEGRRKLPSFVTEQDKPLFDVVPNYNSVLDTLLNQLGEELLHRETEINRLYLILQNIRDVHYLAPRIDLSFNTARGRAGLDEVPPFAGRIRSSLERLYRQIEKLDQKKRGMAELDSLSPTTTKLLKMVAEEAIPALDGRLTLAETVVLYTPGKEDENWRLPSLFFAIEVDSLGTFVELVAAACFVFATSFPSFHGQLIAVPSYKGHRISQRVYQVLAPTLQSVDAPDFNPPRIWTNDGMGEVPTTLLHLQPNEPRPELDLVNQLIMSSEKLAFTRATAEVTTDFLPSDTSRFYQERARSPEFSAPVDQALRELLAFAPAKGTSRAWQKVMRAIDQIVIVLERHPQEFAQATGILADPLDGYVETLLTHEFDPTQS